MNEGQFALLGLKEKENQTYLALLASGPLLANQLAKKTKQVRTTVYSQLDSLVEKGFASYTIQGGKRYYKAVNPQKLLEVFSEKKAEEEAALLLLVESLKKSAGSEKHKTTVEVFEGKEGMKTAMNWALREEHDKIFVYGSSGVSHKIIPIFMQKWHNERVRQKIPMDIIYNRVKETDERLKKGPTLKLMNYRFSPIKDFSIIGTLIFTKRVLLTIWDTDTPIAISIQNEDVIKNYKNNFNILWKAALTPKQIRYA